MSTTNLERLIALMIGISTVTAGLFTWRGGQIGSTAAYNDRQSVGEQIDVETAEVDVNIEAARQARQYDRYLADYAVAGGLDSDAEALRSTGQGELADLAERQAAARRAAATQRATDAGVFGPSTLGERSEAATAQPQAFDLEERIDELRVLESTGLGSASDLQPQRWADESSAIRRRIRNLTYWVGLLLSAVVVLTAAEVTVSRRLRLSGLALGSIFLATAWIGGLATGFMS